MKSSNFFIQLLLIVVLLSFISFAENEVILQENFEDNLDLSEDWTVVNGDEVNFWYAGVYSVMFGGVEVLTSRGAFISDQSGNPPNYNTDEASISHFYREVTFPEGWPKYELRFNWVCLAEAGDYFSVYLAPASFTPMAGEEIPAEYLIGESEYNGESTQKEAVISLDPADYAGQDRKLIFSWKNDGFGGEQPPAIIDNIILQAKNPFFGFKLTPDPGAEEEAFFGGSLDAVGERVAVGSPGQNSSTGSAYVFKKVEGEWEQEDFQLPDDLQNGDQFGVSLAFNYGNPDQLLVGAPGQDKDKGAAYVMEYSELEGWHLGKKLVNPEGVAVDFFGSRLIINDDWIAIAAPNENSVGDQTGAVHMFRYEDNDWNYFQKLFNTESVFYAQFGTDIDFDNEYNKLVVTEPFAIDYPNIHFYEFNGTEWENTDNISNPVEGVPIALGLRVSFQSNQLLATAPGLFEQNEFSGGVLHYQDTGNWDVTKICHLNNDALDLGFNVDQMKVEGRQIDRNYGIYGAFDIQGLGNGRAYIEVFNIPDLAGSNFGNGGGWYRFAELEPDESAPLFGTTVAISENYAVVGAPGDEDNGPNSGAVFIYEDFQVVTDINNNDNKSLPKKFSLEQNYPNPFNPATTINYNLAKSSNVKLIVYDILGREISTLVNDQKPQGSYEISFNAASLASGVYFYKLKTNDFVQVKKMLLMK